MKNDVINNHWREMVLSDDWLHTSTDISTLMFRFPLFQKTSDHKKTTCTIHSKNIILKGNILSSTYNALQN